MIEKNLIEKAREIQKNLRVFHITPRVLPYIIFQGLEAV